jgi:hypothetical protein
MVSLAELFKKGEQAVSQHSTAILTGIGVTGTVTTAVLTGRASFKAARILDLKGERVRMDADRELTKQEQVKAVWQQYIPAAGVGTLTIVSIVLSNRLSSKQAAALAAAYGISERAFQEYKEKVLEKIGTNKETAVRDEIAQDRVNKYPINTKEIILAGTGEVLCFDLLTGRYFQSSVEEIRRAENSVNRDIINHMYASLSSFYDAIGLPPTIFSDTVGWNVNNTLEIKISTVMSPDNRPCIAIDFSSLPLNNYGDLY